MKGPNKPVIGLCGGIASGKSLVARILAELGAGIIASDQLNHEVLNQPDVRQQIRSWWGQDTYDTNGHCRRDKLAQIVFAKDEARRRLEALTHPRIAQLRQAQMQQFETDPNVTAIVIDSPLLFETGLDAMCDVVVFTDSDLCTRIDRVIASRGWDSTELERREKLQIPLDTKRKGSDYLVENNSDTDALRQQVDTIFRQIIAASHPTD